MDVGQIGVAVTVPGRCTDCSETYGVAEVAVSLAAGRSPARSCRRALGGSPHQIEISNGLAEIDRPVEASGWSISRGRPSNVSGVAVFLEESEITHLVGDALDLLVPLIEQFHVGSAKATMTTLLQLTKRASADETTVAGDSCKIALGHRCDFRSQLCQGGAIPMDSTWNIPFAFLGACQAAPG